MKVLVIEDEEQVARFVQHELERLGYRVSWASDGKRAVDIACSEEFDAILLDIVLPGMGGVEIATALRKEHVETPIVMVTGLGATDDVIRGLEAGADDYVTKPFDTGELVARIKAARRRAGRTSLKASSDVVLDLDRSKLQIRNGSEVAVLTPIEFRLLELIMQRYPDPARRDELLTIGCGMAPNTQSNTVDVHVGRLRKKLGSLGASSVIQTVRGQGFRLQVEDFA